MEKYLYCIMDSTTSKEKPGWDVEIFKDTEIVRKAWELSQIGIDDDTMQEYYSRELSVIALGSLKEAKAYVAKLMGIYRMYNITKITQIHL